MANALLAGIAGGATVSIVISAIDKFSGVFANVNKGMLITGGIITGMGVAGVVASKKLVDSAVSFESAFAGVKKTVELTEEEFGKLRQRFIDLSKEIPITFEELSRIGEIAGQLGVEGVDNIAKFTETIAAIAVTTNLSAEEAATSFARIANVMGEPITNIDKMGSAIVDLGNNFATSEQEIVNMATRIMGSGKTIGLTTQEVFGMSAALSSLGIRSEMGGSAISRAMITIAQAVAEGGEELQSYAEVSGMTVEEFSNAWSTKPVEAMSNVIVGLKGITDSGGNTFGVLEDLDLKSIRITDTMLRLAGSEDGITAAVDKSKKAWEENTALVEEAEKRYNTTESQVQTMKNKFTALKVQMGEKLIPTFSRLVDILGDVFEWFSAHPTLTKFSVAALAIGSGLAIIVGPALILVAMLPAMATGFGMLSVSILPITLTILAIAAAFVAVIAAYKAFKAYFKKESSTGVNYTDEDGNIHLNASQEDAEKYGGVIALNGTTGSSSNSISLNGNNSNVQSLNDFILTSSGKIIKPSPQDTIIGTKNPGSLGGSINIQTGDIYGVDADQVAEALGKEIKKVIRL